MQTNDGMTVINSKKECKPLLQQVLQLPFFTSIRKKIHETDISQLVYSFNIIHIRKSVNRYLLTGKQYYFLLYGKVIIQEQRISNVSGPLNVINIAPQEVYMTMLTDAFLGILDAKKFDSHIYSIYIANVKSLMQEIRPFNLFRNSGWRIFELVFNCIDKKTYKKGDIVLREGKSISEVFFIKKGMFRLMKKNQRRIDDNVNEQLDLTNKELICLRKEDILINKCLKEHITLNSDRLISLKKEIDQLNNEIVMRKEEPNQGVMTLLILKDLNTFGDIEFIQQLPQAKHSIVCITQTAEVYIIKYEDLKKLISPLMRKIMTQEVNAKCDLLSNKYCSDIYINIQKNKSKEETLSSTIDQYCSRNDYSLSKLCSDKGRNINERRREKLSPLMIEKGLKANFSLNKIAMTHNKSNKLIKTNNGNKEKTYITSNKLSLKKLNKCISDSNIKVKSDKSLVPSIRNKTNKLAHYENIILTKSESSSNCLSEAVRLKQKTILEQKNQYLRNRIKQPFKKIEFKSQSNVNIFNSSMKSLLAINPIRRDYMKCE